MQTFYLDFQSPGIQPIIHAKQNDSLSRFFKVVLSDNGAPYTIPTNSVLSIRYTCGTSKGWYDTISLPGGTTRSAFSISGSEITCEIAEQCALSPVPGELCLIIQNEGYKIGTFNLRIEVSADPCPDSTIEASDYFSVLTGQTAATLVNANAASASAAAAAESASEAANTLSSKANTEDVINALVLKAPSGYGLGEKSGKIISDCNLAVENGWYRAVNASNCPSTGGVSLNYGCTTVRFPSKFSSEHLTSAGSMFSASIYLISFIRHSFV